MTGPRDPCRALTRRGLLGRAALGTAAAALVTGSDLVTGVALGQARTDDEILTSSIALEQLAAFSYEQIATRGSLAGGNDVAASFARQEHEHADALATVLAQRGGGVPAPPRRLKDVPGLQRAIAGGPRTSAAFALEIEQAAVTAYYAAQGKIEHHELLRTTASIMASEAQHLVVLRSALHRDPAPDPFVTGRRR
ncbi:MAG: ferritin-like domain-containing protein [Thermoleophilaceae bacterium]